SKGAAPSPLTRVNPYRAARGTEHEAGLHWRRITNPSVGSVPTGPNLRGTVVMNDAPDLSRETAKEETSEYGDTLESLQQRRPGAREALDRLAGDVRGVNERYINAAFRAEPSATRAY